MRGGRRCWRRISSRILLLNELQSIGQNAETAYQKYWQHFDDNSDFWRAEVGRGNAKRARIETFLQNALALMAGQEISAGHLYTAYRDFAADGKEQSELAMSDHDPPKALFCTREGWQARIVRVEYLRAVLLVRGVKDNQPQLKASIAESFGALSPCRPHCSAARFEGGKNIREGGMANSKYAKSQ